MKSKTAASTIVHPAHDEADSSDSSRQAWEAPRVHRLATSSAELGPNPNADAEGGS